MNIIGDDAMPDPIQGTPCNGPSLEGVARMIHDGAGALIQILMVLAEATHQGETVSLTALSAVHDACDAVTVGWMMAQAQEETEKISLQVRL